MQANPSSPALPSAGPSPYCGPDGGRGWGFWPLIPVLLLAGGLLLTAVAWSFGGAGGWGGPAPFFWPIFPFGFFLFFVVVFFAFRFAWRGRGWWGGPLYWRPSSSAREVVRERYARGEISKEQLAKMIQDLDQVG
jgi:putative membrane protein